MGTSGLVGQLMTWQTMSSYTSHAVLLVEILLCILYYLQSYLMQYIIIWKENYVCAERL